MGHHFAVYKHFWLGRGFPNQTPNQTMWRWWVMSQCQVQVLLHTCWRFLCNAACSYVFFSIILNEEKHTLLLRTARLRKAVALLREVFGDIAMNVNVYSIQYTVLLGHRLCKTTIVFIISWSSLLSLDVSIIILIIKVNTIIILLAHIFLADCRPGGSPRSRGSSLPH